MKKILKICIILSFTFLLTGCVDCLVSLNYSKIKIAYDVICLTITAILTGFGLGHIEGLGIGTVLAAFTMGKVVGLIGESMDKHINIEPLLVKKIIKKKTA